MTWKLLLAQEDSPDRASKVLSIATGKPMGYEGFRTLQVFADPAEGLSPEEIKTQADTPGYKFRKNRSEALNSVTFFKTDSASLYPDTIWTNDTMSSTCVNNRNHHSTCDSSGCKNTDNPQQVAKCHRGDSSKLIKDCPCGIYAFPSIVDTFHYDTPEGQAVSIPVRLLMHGNLWKGRFGMRANAATLTGIVTPSSLRRSLPFGRLGHNITDERVQDFAKKYDIPLLDYSSDQSNWPTSAQVLHRKGFR